MKDFQALVLFEIFFKLYGVKFTLISLSFTIISLQYNTLEFHFWKAVYHPQNHYCIHPDADSSLEFQEGIKGSGFLFYHLVTILLVDFQMPKKRVH